MRILIVKLSSLGDLFHALPTATALRKGLGATLDWAVQPEYASLVRCFRGVDRVIPIPRHRVLRDFRPALRALRAERYDAAVDLQGLLKSAVVARLARTSLRVGPAYNREGSALAYDKVPPRGGRERHAVEQALDVLQCFDLPRPDKAEFPMDFPPYPLDVAGPRIALLPVSRWSTKNWPAGHFAALAERLAKELGATPVVLGSKDDALTCEAVCRAAPQARNLCGALSLPELGGLLSQVDLLVSNDSGPVHLAAALGKPCLVFFGPTIPGRTGPYGGNHRVLRRSLPCQPCLSRDCSVGGIPCLADITPDEAFAAAKEMLALS
ncbi:MAG: glycosyltransferase family 9 protein [Kiritimatiellia bacterium]|jgi:heptosyltransferase-1